MNLNYFDPHYFIFKLPIYSKVPINADTIGAFHALMSFDGRLNEYSITLNEQTTYDVVYYPYRNARYTPLTWEDFEGTRRFQLKCLRNDDFVEVFFHIVMNTDGHRFAEKIGQTPSIADMQIGQVRDYAPVLKKEKLNEFTKAIGLATHGVGIGSFVYLRRIFEYLITKAHEEAKSEQDWIEEKYSGLRIVEKIELLKTHLPVFLVENKNLYGILSVGIHELEENECLQNFEIVKVGIELILDEKLEQVKKAKKIEEAKKMLNTVSQNLGAKQFKKLSK